MALASPDMARPARLITHHLPQPRAVATQAGQAYSGSPSPPPPTSFPPPPPSTQSARWDLLRDNLQGALSRPGVLAERVLSGVRAVATVSTETAQSLLSGQPDRPEVILRKLFERLGPTYIKLGQLIASTPSLFPAEYSREMEKCLDRTPAMPWREVEGVLKAAFRTQALSSVFESIDRAPLATGSIAQVHRAVLRENRREVAVKVVRPGVDNTIFSDLSLLHVLSQLAELANPELGRLSLQAIVGDLRASMLDEVDMVKEAHSIGEFQEYLEKSGLGSIATCPHVHRHLSSKRVLVMDLLRGTSLVDLGAIQDMPGTTPERVLFRVLNTWFGSLAQSRSFHADLHSGNLLVMPDGRVGFLDFGIVGRLRPTTWHALDRLQVAIVEGDYDTMARALLTLDATSSDVDLQTLAKDLEGIVESFKGLVPASGAPPGAASPQGRADVAELLMGDSTRLNSLMLQVMNAGERSGIRFPRDFGLVLKQLVYFDRYIQLLAPRMSYTDVSVNRPGLADVSAAPRPLTSV